MQSQRTLTHLQRLEAESIHIMREAVAESERPVMLYSVGKDSSVMLHLAIKAFYPSLPPFPLLHVDTTWKFQEMYAFRDRDGGRPRAGPDRPPEPRVCPTGHQPLRPRLGHAHRHVEDRGAQAGPRSAPVRPGLRRGTSRRGEVPRQGAGLLHPLGPAPVGSRNGSAPSCGAIYNARTNPGETVRVFPLSNWTELDIWQYIHLEEIPIVPLYYAAPRPVVERDGTLIMVDDDRMPLEADEVPEQRSVRFRTLGCYPLTGAIESTADTLTGIIQEMLLTTSSERQGRVIDHDSARRPWRRRSRRATSEVAHLDPLIADDIEAYLDHHEHKSLLRFITCGSVDDGKSTLIGRFLYESKLVFEDHLAALEADSKKVGTQGGELDFALLVDGLAAEREQGITIDVAYRFFSTETAQVRGRRHAGSRAVHAQHGHRRVDRRAGRHPRRRPQGDPHPDPPAQLPGLAARHPPRRPRRQQARPGRLLPRGLRLDRRRLPRLRGGTRHHRRRLHPPVRASWRQRHRAQSPTRPGTTARRWCSTWSRSRSTTTSTPSRSDSWSSGSTAPTSTSVATRA